MKSKLHKYLKEIKSKDVKIKKKVRGDSSEPMRNPGSRKSFESLKSKI